MTTELITCITCGARERDEQGRTRGEQLFAALTSAQGEKGSAISLSTIKCLWSCTRSCSVHLRAPARVGYVLGDLEPSSEHAHALLDYAALYSESTDGSVPFRKWPPAVKGHFVCRVPPPMPERSAKDHEDAP